MKTTKTLALLLAALAASNSATAQARQELPASQPYMLSGAPAQSTEGSISYQWYRDGQPIPGATDPDYLLPGHLAYGTNVVFRRGATGSDCPGSVTYTNEVRVSFGLRVDTVNWASVNVAAYQTFAARPDMYTQFYQCNRATAWAATGDVYNWPSTNIFDNAWLVNPCPAGWRLPTREELIALPSTGFSWAETYTKGNNVAGMFFGPNSQTCSLPNSMAGCVFVPASGVRENLTGELVNQGTISRLWSRTVVPDAGNSYALHISTTSSGTPGIYNNARGHNIRCVQVVN